MILVSLKRSIFNYFYTSEESGVFDTLMLEFKFPVTRVELIGVQILVKCHCDGMGLYFQRKGKVGVRELQENCHLLCNWIYN